jgi:hypothetical protein
MQEGLVVATLAEFRQMVPKITRRDFGRGGETA